MREAPIGLFFTDSKTYQIQNRVLSTEEQQRHQLTRVSSGQTLLTYLPAAKAVLLTRTVSSALLKRPDARAPLK
jgi:hypothetical protein